MYEKVTRTFTITANKEMMAKIEMLLAWMHFNTAWGHSAKIAVSCDGDGADKVRVEPKEAILPYKEFVSRLPGERIFAEYISLRDISVKWELPTGETISVK